MALQVLRLQALLSRVIVVNLLGKYCAYFLAQYKQCISNNACCSLRKTKQILTRYLWLWTFAI